MSAPREDLVRSVPFQLVRAEEGVNDDGLTLEGYAAVFGQRTLIDSWEGQFYESIKRGAFRKSIRERTPVLQFDHGRHPLIGSIPIGRIEDLREDDDGLFTSARLSDNWLIEPVRDAIAEGSIDGMSFRFSVVREEWRDKDGKIVKAEELGPLLWDPGERGPLERTLTEVKCAELGPVVWPAYEGTSVGVRAREVASLISRDGGHQRGIRAGLARDADALPATESALSDPNVRREVARELLFGTTKTPDAPAPEGHPSVETPSNDAPPAGHPSTDIDAPPLDGHPSADEGPVSALRDEIRQWAAGAREHIEEIEG